MKITDKIQITNEDNMELMARYPDKYFDLAIVDPPYGIGAENHAGNKENGWTQWVKKDWDKVIPTAEYWQELFRVSKNQIVWGANYMTEYLPPKMGWIVWDKGQRCFSLADGELAWTSFDKAMRIFTYARAKALKEGKIHPTQKPIELYKWILDNYATCKSCKNTGSYMEDVAGDGGSRMEQPCDCIICEDDKIRSFRILDTHLGSGSIAIACHDYGFELTACELDKEYYYKAVERIKNHVSQQKLF